MEAPFFCLSIYNEENRSDIIPKSTRIVQLIQFETGQHAVLRYVQVRP